MNYATGIALFGMGFAACACIVALHDRNGTWQAVWFGAFFVSALVAIAYRQRD